MSCCAAIEQPFTNVSTVSTPYGAIQKSAYGQQPNVQVYIWDGTDYVLSDDGNQVVVGESSIEISMGGPATGFIKIF